MAVDEAATSPERAAVEIHRQLGAPTGPVPVFEIARALDIEKIEQRPLDGFEAMLLTGLERDFGHVLLNGRSSPRRRRYSLAHELGHFLCVWHKQTREDGFACRSTDMVSPRGPSYHVTQEREANAFAIELLAPVALVRPYLKRLPDLDVVLEMHLRLDISKVAAARRYVNLHAYPLAVVIAKNGVALYVDRNPTFPFLEFAAGQSLPELPMPPAGRATSEMIDADARDWRLSNVGRQLFCQTLVQDEGYALVLLQLEATE